MTPAWQVGIDIGGTFTDVVARGPDRGDVRAAKVATTPGDRAAGLAAALAAVGLGWGDITDLVLGTTMITNAIVEDDLAPVALITTRGFGDTLAIGRQNRRALYHLDPPAKAPPQVPAARRFEVEERLDHTGAVEIRLGAEEIARAVARAKASGARAVAVALLHAYANPAHEEALGRALAKDFDHVALSAHINPEAREYERMATTVLSASAMPLAAGELDRLEAARPATARLHLFHSAGGMAAPAMLRARPLGLAMSGPAAGVAAACQLARALAPELALSFDMGGTTTDVCLIRDGKALVASDLSLAGRPIRQPMVAVGSIGAGGGSIARLDHGALRVGPESAGAVPGPACYGKGGSAPTVSDANLLLGYLDADRLLGGDLRLDRNAARTAIAPLARAMAMPVEAAALGILRVANATMVRALRRITVEQGVDGRAATLIAYGGAGPMHAVEVAREFGISRVVVPAFSSMFSARGCVDAEMSHSRQRTIRMGSEAWDAPRLNAARAEMRAGLVADLPAGSAPLVEEVALLRYRGQSYAIELARPALDNPESLGDAFRAEHARLYGFATGEPWELKALRLTARLPRPARRP